MKVYKLGEIHNRFIDFKFQWYTFHMVGVRSSSDRPNAFDDTFYLINDKMLFQFSCTTNPGTYWLRNIMPGKSGTAILKSDMQYKDCWALGKHKGLHPALIQVRDVVVYRDFDKDLKSEEIGKQETGLFGINIHRANDSLISKVVDRWSAGCQVIPDPKAMDFILDKCRDSGQKFFTYTLLKEW